MYDTAEALLDAARTVQRRLRAELIATEASAKTDDKGAIDGEVLKCISRLQAKVRYLNSIVERHEQELGNGWIPSAQEPSYAGSHR